VRVVHLPAAERRAVPWKNGGGVTEEIAVHPSGAGFDDFAWRISMARVEQGGPFSRFPGVDRTLAVLEGRMRLDLEGWMPASLSPAAEPLAFPGDRAAHATVVEPVRDLNVMCRRGRFRADVRRLGGPVELTADTVLLLARAPCVVRWPDGEASLAAGDALRVEGGAGQRLDVAGDEVYVVALHVLEQAGARFAP
jgi:hypothetical protein